MSNDAQPKRRRRRRALLWILSILALLLLARVLRDPVLRSTGSWLVDVDTPAPADIIIVLGGHSGYRVKKAVDLYREGLAPVIGMTAPAPEFEALESPPSLRWLGLLEAFGVARDSVVVLAPSYSTFDDARLVRDYVSAHGVQSVLLVTDPYHTRRAAWFFRRMLIGTDVEVRMVAADLPDHDLETWWRDEHQFLGVLVEYVKLAYYVRSYGWRGLPEGVAAAHRTEEAAP